MTTHHHQIHPAADAQTIIRLRDEVLATAPVDDVPVADLVVAYSPRLAGEDSEYIRALAESESQLPPLVVHRATMTVIDGIHRLRAAVSNSRTTIAVCYFDGSLQEAALLAVALNVGHGRPLSLDDRSAAAQRIFASHPHWSDRAVALLAGLSATKVATLRGAAQSSVRIGRDGRARPLDATAGRERARELLEQKPTASMRQIARDAGISAATAADVRDRICRGESAVPARREGPLHPGPVTLPPQRVTVPAQPRTVKSPTKIIKVVEAMHRDPSLRQNEAGRALLRMLGICAVFAREHEHIAAAIPQHCRAQLAELMHDHAQVCQDFADQVNPSVQHVS